MTTAFQFGDWQVEPGLNRIGRDGRHKQIEPKAMELLACLLERAPHTVTADELHNRLFDDRDARMTAVDERIAHLRRALHDESDPPRYLGVGAGGYRALAHVSAAPSDRADGPLMAELAAETPPFPAYVGDAPYVFVCYAHADRVAVYAELVRLRDASINVWYDEGITPGSEWTEEIADAIGNCSAVLFFASKASIGSKHCQNEIQFARVRGAPLVVAHLEAVVLPSGLGYDAASSRGVIEHHLRDAHDKRDLASVVRRQVDGRGANRRRPNDRAKVRWWRSAAAGGVVLTIGALLAYTFSPSQPHITEYRQVTKSQERYAPTVSPFPIVTDGVRIYFVEWRGGDLALRQVSINGGESVLLPNPFTREQNPYIAGITPDGTQLVVGAAGPGTEGVVWPRWLWSPSGGSPRRLDIDRHDVNWSADGSILVSAATDIYVARGDGSESRKIATAPGLVGWARVSPDNSRIRFTAQADDGTFTTLWEVSIDGANMHRVLPDWNACCGSWTPDGKYYVFQATRGVHTELWAVRDSPLPAEPIELTPGGMDFMYPTLTPDGRHILAIGWRLQGEVMRYDVANKRWVPHFSNRSAEWLMYSGDGQWVSYVTYPEGDLWRSRADGSEPLRIASAPFRPGYAIWSADNKTLAFYDTATARVYIAAADGSAPPRRLTKPDRAECCPTWSPDGRTIAITREPRGISLVDVGSANESPLEGSDAFQLPQWWPDGRYLTAIEDGKGIVQFDFETRRWREIASVPDIMYHAASLDGQFVYCANGLGVSRVHVADGSVERIVSIADQPWVYGVLGFHPWIGVTPDGAPLYLRDNGVYHIYALALKM